MVATFWEIKEPATALVRSSCFYTLSLFSFGSILIQVHDCNSTCHPFGIIAIDCRSASSDVLVLNSCGMVLFFFGWSYLWYNTFGSNIVVYGGLQGQNLISSIAILALTRIMWSLHWLYEKELFLKNCWYVLTPIWLPSHCPIFKLFLPDQKNGKWHPQENLLIEYHSIGCQSVSTEPRDQKSAWYFPFFLKIILLIFLSSSYVSILNTIRSLFLF